MSFKRFAIALSAAVATCWLGIGSPLAGDRDGKSVRFADDYAGYHLRPPYYLPRLGWHYPPRHADRSLYYGYHFHHDHPPLVSRARRAVVVHRPAVQYIVLPADHVAWCRGRYRSYRAHDNSFQPDRGGRRQCWSPYS
jgi:hypothetical protein